MFSVSNRMNLLSVLAEKNIIDERDIPSIKEEANTSGDSIENVLIKRGIDLNEVLRIKGEYLNVPTWTLGDKKIPFEVFKYIPEESAVYYRFVQQVLKALKIAHVRRFPNKHDPKKYGVWAHACILALKQLEDKT